MNLLNSEIRGISEIRTLLPQREPMIMIDAVIYMDDEKLIAELKVEQTNVFFENRCLQEAGVIEHMAQCAAVQDGIKRKAINKNPRLGYIAAINDFEISTLPKLGDILKTAVFTTFHSTGLKKLKMESRLGDLVIATSTITVVLNDN